ncbi:MAG: nucleoside phosphorylase, partial [Thermodesulfobacteria bacterium]|nr:nucleoside phosphorylase [Thermodesulfobacteriota bacterium]
FGRDEIFLCGPVLGAPQAAIALEYLKASGVREILTFGWAGALREELPLGSLFLPEKALSAEGTSSHYGYHPYPSRELFWWLYHELVAQGLVFEVGTVVSTDALFREDEDFLARFSAAQVVDMETSALFSVGKALGISLASLLLLSDRLVPRYERLKVKDLRKTLAGLLPVFRAFFERKNTL